MNFELSTATTVGLGLESVVLCIVLDLFSSVLALASLFFCRMLFHSIYTYTSKFVKLVIFNDSHNT